jgi:hypothetical protein
MNAATGSADRIPKINALSCRDDGVLAAVVAVTLRRQASPSTK